MLLTSAAVQLAAVDVVVGAAGVGNMRIVAKACSKPLRYSCHRWP